MRQGPRLFGKTLGHAFGVSDARSLVLRSENDTTLAAITYVHSPTGQPDPTNPQASEKGFTIPVHLAQPNALNWGSWVDGRYTHTPHWRCGGIGIFDLESLPRVLRDTPFKVLHFNIPRPTFNAFTEDADLPTVEHLRCEEGHLDPVLYHLAEMIRPYLCKQVGLSALFLDHYIQMLCSHIVMAYGAPSLPHNSHKGGLAPWQKRRAIELLEHNLSGNLRLSRLAQECGVSTGYFCKCFRATFGTSLHRFVVAKRIERAIQLLLHSGRSIAEIAIEVGFSDQAAFSRTFSANIGAPPARWRMERSVRIPPSMEASGMNPGQPCVEKEIISHSQPFAAIPALVKTRYKVSRIRRIKDLTFQ
jgi:AraC family transcriptional regulator